MAWDTQAAIAATEAFERRLRQIEGRHPEVVSEVRDGSAGVATASSGIAQSDLDLSARTDNQAQSLKNTIASFGCSNAVITAAHRKRASLESGRSRAAAEYLRHAAELDQRLGACARGLRHRQVPVSTRSTSTGVPGASSPATTSLERPSRSEPHRKQRKWRPRIEPPFEFSI